MRAKHEQATAHGDRRRVAGQATLEYAVFVAVVAAAVGAMAVYVRRAIQANLKQVEDRLNAEAAP